MHIQEMKTEPYLHPSGNDEVTLHFPAPQAQRRPRWFAWALLVWLFLVMATAVFGILGFAYFSGVIFPGVHVLQSDIGGMSRNEATAVLQSAWAQQTITLDAGTDAYSIAPQEIGIVLDVNQTASEAVQFGRTIDSWQHILQTQSGAMQPIVQIDSAASRTALQQLKQQLDQPAIDSHVQIENGQATAVSAAPGRSLDVETTLAHWQTMTRLPQDGRLPLIIQSIQPTVFDASDQVAQANRLLATTFTINGYDPIRNETITWQLTPDVWGDWLSLHPNAGSFTWVFDEQMAGGYFAGQSVVGNGRFIKSDEAVSAMSGAIDSQQTQLTLRLYHQPSEYIIQPGDSFASIGYDTGIPYPWLQQANPTVSTLSVGQAITIPSPDEMLPFPVIPNKRIILSISQQRAWVYENGQIIWEWPISTGIASSPTAPGVFQIQTHVDNAYAANWNLWMPHFMGIYRPVPTSDFMNGFHGFPTRDGANLLWTQNLGAPVTYGCILLSNENAATLYTWAEEGVIVEIQR